MPIKKINLLFLFSLYFQAQCMDTSPTIFPNKEKDQIKIVDAISLQCPDLATLARWKRTCHDANNSTSIEAIVTNPQSAIYRELQENGKYTNYRIEELLNCLYKNIPLTLDSWQKYTLQDRIAYTLKKPLAIEEELTKKNDNNISLGFLGFVSYSVPIRILDRISINKAYSLNQTPLMQAIKAKNLGLTEFYIKNGAEVNGFFKNGSYQDDMTSPLIFAIASSTPEMVKLLLDNGADPNLQYKCEEKFVGTSQTYNYQSPTALHRACRVCDPSKVRLLLQAGANPNARDHYGKMPLHWACDEGSDNNFLANRCFNESTNYKNPFLKNCITIIGLLLKHGADKRDWKHFLDPTRNLNPEIAYAVDH